TGLLNTRTAELKGAESFLSTADAVTGAHVIDSIRRLNNEFMQEYTSAVERVREIMGTKLVDCLADKNHQNEPLLIQIALQSYFAVIFQWVIASWTADDSRMDSCLKTVWEHIRAREVQAVSGKWRALTIASLNTADGGSIIKGVLRDIRSILVAAKCTTPTSDIRASLEAKYASQIGIMEKMATDVRKNIGEDVTSTDFEVFFTHTGSDFDPESMADAYNDESPTQSEQNRGRVLCPTDLGLLQRTNTARGKDAKWSVKLLLKPKVALESVIDALEG
ncbi:hypothetical protein CONPUDRAFT_57878, partial [Coniophora puteana RWD-64-598 SS2]